MEGMTSVLSLAESHILPRVRAARPRNITYPDMSEIVVIRGPELIEESYPNLSKISGIKTPINEAQVAQKIIALHKISDSFGS